jgi:hypothetical protein
MFKHLFAYGTIHTILHTYIFFILVLHTQFDLA